MEKFKNKYRSQSTRLKGWNYANPGYYFVTICIKNRKRDFGSIANGKMILSAAGEIVNAEWLKPHELRKNIILDEFQIMPDHLHGIIIITYNMNEFNYVENPDKTDVINVSNVPDVSKISNESGVLNVNDGTNVDNVTNVDTRGTVYLHGHPHCHPHGHPHNNHFHIIPHPENIRVKTNNLLSPEQYIRMGFSRTYKNKFGPQRNNIASIIGGFKSAAKTKISITEPSFGWQDLYDDHVIRNSGELNRIRNYIRSNPKNWNADT